MEVPLLSKIGHYRIESERKLLNDEVETVQYRKNTGESDYSDARKANRMFLYNRIRNLYPIRLDQITMRIDPKAREPR